MKKGDLSMNTIVMAVIAVIVLIILAALIINNIRPVSEATRACPGECVDGYSCDDGSGRALVPYSQAKCPRAGETCCVPG